ncbi:MAG: SWIM zinc finger family protein [Desulfobacteraceae bacterium]
MRYSGFPEYVPVAERRAKAERKIRQLKKKNPGLDPVIIEGRAISTTFWGKQWNRNLERYADFENRIGRGRSYVRHNAVLDLTIDAGKVSAKVLGSGSRVYKVSISIKPIPKKRWAEIRKECRGRLDSLKKLAAGKFPKDLSDLFTKKGKGLFPSPEEIEFDCSCPDIAYMCKHVAAVLYGIGARLDKDPNLFFVLRRADMNELVEQTVKESRKDLLSKAEKKTSRVIKDESSLSDMFGIELEPLEDSEPAEPETRKPGPRKKKKTSAEVPLAEQIEQMIRSRKKGMAVAELIRKSGLPAQKVRNTVFYLKKKGKIENISRGVYKAVT